MNSLGLQFHHLGLAVRRPERALRFLAGLGYRAGPLVLDPLQNVNLVFCEGNGMPDVELIYPTQTPGPLDAMLGGFDELIYHSCYVCEDLELALTKMKREHRVITVLPPKPAVLFGDRRVSFYRVAGFGIIEILETGPTGSPQTQHSQE